MIVVDRITKYYSQHKALDEVSFSIGTREIAGFLGLNGAGKTTMLKILSGLMIPSSGRFSLHGQDGQSEDKAVRCMVGFLPDRPPLYDDMRVRDMLAFAARLNGVPERQLRKRVNEVLEMTNLEPEADNIVGWLSHGYRQRLGIAQAIVHRPPVVILDEPISGLDPIQIIEMRNLVKTIGEEHTVLLSSHILSEISQTCDRILVLSQGRIVAQGTEQELGATMTSARICLTVRGDREKIIPVLHAVDSNLIGEISSLDSGVFQFEVDSPTLEAREDVVSSMVSAGFRIREVREIQTGLENVFIHLAGENDAGESPEEGAQ